MRGSCRYSLILAVYSASSFCLDAAGRACAAGRVPPPRARWRRQSRQRVENGDSSVCSLATRDARFIAHFPQRSAPGAHADPGRAGASARRPADRISIVTVVGLRAYESSVDRADSLRAVSWLTAVTDTRSAARRHRGEACRRSPSTRIARRICVPGGCDCRRRERRRHSALAAQSAVR